MRSSSQVRWLLALLAVTITAACGTSEPAAPTSSPAPPGPTADERQALAAYQQFWSVSDAALAAPGERDWTSRLQEVATGQALDSLRRDVDNYAGVPAHTEGAVTRAPKVAGSMAGRVDIVDCIDLGNSRLVSDADGQVLDDLANRVPRYVYRAGVVNLDGRWLVDRTAPALDQPC